MEFTFTADQMAFRDSVSRFLMTEAPPEMLREVWDTDAGRSPELRRKIAEQGLTGLSVPETEGGLGLGDIDWVLMTQELGYYAIPDSLTDTAYVASAMIAGLAADTATRSWPACPKATRCAAPGCRAWSMAAPALPWAIP